MTIKKESIKPKVVLKYSAIGLAAIVVLGLIFVAIKQVTKVDKSGFGTDKTACQILNKDTVTNAFGPPLKMVLDKNTVGDTDSNGIKTSTCLYKEKGGNDGSETVAVLTVKSVQAENGSANLKAAFAKKPKDSQGISSGAVSGWWNPKTGEINVTKGGTWYVIRSGSNKPKTFDIGDSIKLAEPLNSRLQ